MSNRIKLLKEFITEDPGDPFNYYALGLEYLQSDKQQALSTFQRLIREHKDYLPTYYQLGKLYESLGQPDQAVLVFGEGILLAKSQNDLKTLRELSAGLEEINGG